MTAWIATGVLFIVAVFVVAAAISAAMDCKAHLQGDA